MSKKKLVIKDFSHLFWEYNQKDLSLLEDKELIIKRVLSHGSVEDLRNLRKALGDEEIKAVLMKIKGRGIERRRLRFYQVIFCLPKKEVDSWLKDALRDIWEKRCRK